MEISDKELIELWNPKYFMQLIAIQSQGKQGYWLREAWELNTAKVRPKLTKLLATSYFFYGIRKEIWQNC